MAPYPSYNGTCTYYTTPICTSWSDAPAQYAEYTKYAEYTEMAVSAGGASGPVKYEAWSPRSKRRRATAPLEMTAPGFGFVPKSPVLRSQGVRR